MPKVKAAYKKYPTPSVVTHGSVSHPSGLPKPSPTKVPNQSFRNVKAPL